MLSRGLTVERVPLPEVPWAELDRRPDRTVFQTLPWLDFLAETQGAEPVVAQVRSGGDVVGWFTGAIVRYGGVRFLGSPLKGWTTSYMGFNLDDPSCSAPAMTALRTFAFRDLGCLHLELLDRHTDVPRDDPPPGYRAWRLSGVEARIDLSDDDLLGRMTKNGRRDVRRALRNGIVVEEVDPIAQPGFASEYYEQVSEAFAKRSLAPTYSVDRVEAMIRHLHPSGNVVLLRARDPDGRPVATGLFPGLAGAAAVFWMGGSRRESQHLLPNEALMWTALRTWRDRGAVTFDFGGGGKYKHKYGGQPAVVPWFRASRWEVLEHARTGVQRMVRLSQRRAGRTLTSSSGDGGSASPGDSVSASEDR